MLDTSAVEFGFAFKGPNVVHNDLESRSIYSIMEDRVVREARRLESQGVLKIVSDPVRTKYKQFPYVFVLVHVQKRDRSHEEDTT